MNTSNEEILSGVAIQTRVDQLRYEKKVADAIAIFCESMDIKPDAEDIKSLALFLHKALLKSIKRNASEFHLVKITVPEPTKDESPK